MGSEGKFWQFSLGFYAKPKVQEACLSLQDKYSADVNIVLYLLYQASLNKQLTEKAILQIDKAVSEFREQIIQPIREIRRSLKGKTYNSVIDADSLYQSTLDLELSAEKLEQNYLDTLSLGIKSNLTTLSTAQLNLHRYAKILGISEKNEAIETLIRHFAP